MSSNREQKTSNEFPKWPISDSLSITRPNEQRAEEKTYYILYGTGEGRTLLT